MMKLIKKRWKAVGNDLAGSKRYFQQAPSNMLQAESLGRLLAVHAKGTLLDVGAGRSVYRQLMPEGIAYTAMDYDSTESEYKKENKLDIVGDVQNMPLEDGSFNTVLCSEVLEHVPRPWDGAKEIIRVLKPGGRAIITVPFLGYYHNVPWDYYRFTSHGLKELFTDDSITVVHEESLGGLFSYIGYIRSTILLSLVYHVPVIFEIAFWMNVLHSKLDILIDKITGTSSLMPVTNVIVIEKKSIDTPS